jgi:hypothetical protein
MLRHWRRWRLLQGVPTRVSSRPFRSRLQPRTHPAKSAYNIGIPESLCEKGRHLLKQIGADLMTENIVDLLEIVHVDEQDGERLTRRSPDEQQHSLLICQLRFDQAGLAPVRLKQEVSQTRHLIPLLQTFPRAIEACSAFTHVTACILAKSLI